MLYKVTYNLTMGGLKSKILQVDKIEEQGSYTDFYADDGIALSIPTEKVEVIECLPENGDPTDNPKVVDIGKRL